MKKIILIIPFILLICGCTTKEETPYDNIVSNKNESISISQTINNILFDNESIYYQDNVSTLTFKIKNTSNDVININNIYVKVKNANETVITELNINISNSINSNEEKLITMYSDIDLTNAYYLEFSID